MPKKPRGPRIVTIGAGDKPKDKPSEVPARLVPAVDRSKIPEMKRAGGKSMHKLTDAVVGTYARPVLTEFFQSLLEGVTRGDTATMRLASEVYGLTQSKGGFVINNIQQNNTVVAPNNTRKFDNLVRMIEQEERADVIDV